MSDPYRPNTGYYPPQQPYSHQPYGSSGYVPQAQQQLTQHQSSYYDNRPPSSHSPSHYPSHQPPYAPPTGPGAYADSRDYYEDEKKPKKDHSTEKGIGATLVGGGAGAFLGHELGGGALGTVGGMIAGAVGANALERRHERHKRERSNSAHSHRSSHSRHGSSHGGSSSGGGLLGKFLHPDRASSRDGRSRSVSRDRSRDRDGGSDGEGRHRHRHHHHHRHGDGSRSRSRGDEYERY